MTDVRLHDPIPWLTSQRWFSAKDRQLVDCTVESSPRLPGGADEEVWLVTIRTEYRVGPADRWLVVLGPSGDGAGASVIATVDGSAVVDIADNPHLALPLLAAATEGSSSAVAARLMGVEQSNTSVIVDLDGSSTSLVVKVIRKQEPGPNPDLEITAALTDSGFPGVPAMRGSMTGRKDAAMVMVSDLVAGARGAWELAVEEAAGASDHGIARGMADLGALTAALHSHLAQLFPTRTATADQTGRWVQGLRQDAMTTAEVLPEGAASEQVMAAGQQLVAAGQQLVAAADRAVADLKGTGLGILQRVHGDFHLGQVLLDDSGKWWLLDFEGEPSRTVAERRLPNHPIKDVAGMLRSLDYARGVAVTQGADPNRAAAWMTGCRQGFLEGYGPDRQGWIQPFEIEKLLYEIRYEAANRPDWLHVPMDAVERMTLQMPTPEHPEQNIQTEEVLGDVDVHLLREGRHEEAWNVMGANRRQLEGQDGVAFAVWAPNAQAARVVGDFNGWDGREDPMDTVGDSGIWTVFVPGVQEGARYSYELVTSGGDLVTRADPWAKWTGVPPDTASRVFTSTHTHTRTRTHTHTAPPVTPPEPAHASPMSIYEVHLGSWRHLDGQPLTYRELSHQLADYVTAMGFTHVELLPPAEHPFGGSWGYQVTGQFAPTSRFGTPDDFRFMVDHLHQMGVGVIVDWVPAHFPRDEWAMRLFDGTALYEHADPRLGEHPDWGTMVFNYGRTEVRNFLVASALFWLESIGVDGLRVDAVASMLYLDYSRNEGEWIANRHGGRENLEAVELLQEVNATVYKRNPGAFTVAEESTAWPGVTRPTHLGGLGFGFKWNMGWMNDTLSYFSRDPVHRRWHHDQLTFGMMYAFSENFILPLSHDEVVHGKGSLIGKMPGDRWRQFANLRALYGWMWGHPGKKLLFMGQEFGQDREWSEERELDWFLLDDQPDEGETNRHVGLQSLVRDINTTYCANPAMWRRDVDPQGFEWIDANNADAQLLSFIRHGEDEDPDVAVIANLSPIPLHNVRFGLSISGTWEEILNTDSAVYGGSNVGNMGAVEATDQPCHGLPASGHVTCPPLGVVWLRAPS